MLEFLRQLSCSAAQSYKLIFDEIRTFVSGKRQRNFYSSQVYTLAFYLGLIHRAFEIIAHGVQLNSVSFHSLLLSAFTNACRFYQP